MSVRLPKPSERFVRIKDDEGPDMLGDDISGRVLKVTRVVEDPVCGGGWFEGFLAGTKPRRDRRIMCVNFPSVAKRGRSKVEVRKGGAFT